MSWIIRCSSQLLIDSARRTRVFRKSPSATRLINPLLLLICAKNVGTKRLSCVRLLKRNKIMLTSLKGHSLCTKSRLFLFFFLCRQRFERTERRETHRVTTRMYVLQCFQVDTEKVKVDSRTLFRGIYRGSRFARLLLHEFSPNVHFAKGRRRSCGTVGIK